MSDMCVDFGDMVCFNVERWEYEAIAELFHWRRVVHFLCQDFGMLTREDKILLDAAIEREVSRLKRQQANGPAFEAVAKTVMAQYTSLSAKISEMVHEASQPPKK